MKKTKPKRKKAYKPKYVSVNPASTFFGGMSREHSDHLRITNLWNHGALANLAKGEGTKEDWNRVVGAINIANVMCEQGIGNEFREKTIAARDALLALGKRGLRTGRFLFTGDELRAVNEGMACHDTQLENVRSIELDRAADEVERRVKHGINSTSVRAEMEKESA